MKLKTNLFERITQHFYEDGGDVHWWIDESEEADFIESWGDDHDVKKTGTRVISGKAWNEMAIGSPYGDFEGYFMNEDCPHCGHLLVMPAGTTQEENHRFCSECSYRNEELRTCEDEFDKNIRNSKPEGKLTIPNETIFEFMKRTGLEVNERDNVTVQAGKIWTMCVKCKRVVPAKEWFIGTETQMAIISFAHDNCTNGGPLFATPFTKKAHDKLMDIL